MRRLDCHRCRPLVAALMLGEHRCGWATIPTAASASFGSMSCRTPIRLISNATPNRCGANMPQAACPNATSSMSTPRFAPSNRRDGTFDLHRPIPKVHDLIASEILPGFRFRVADLLRRVEDETLLDRPDLLRFSADRLACDRVRAEAMVAKRRGSKLGALESGDEAGGSLSGRMSLRATARLKGRPGRCNRDALLLEYLDEGRVGREAIMLRPCSA